MQREPRFVVYGRKSLDTSFPSQHRPAHHGGSLGDAKQALVWEETGDEDDNRLDAWKN